MYKKLRIFVYSGTGNTLKAADGICRAASEKGVDSSVSMIDFKSEPGEFRPDKSTLLGLMSSTLGAIQPLSFFKFVFKLPKGNGTPAFLAATGGWTRIGRLFIPGYIGFGLYFAALVLLLKGYMIVGVDGFGMPHNWTTLIPPYRKKLEARICVEIEQTTKDFIEKILSGKKIFKRMIDLIVTVLIFPLPIAFLVVGRLFLAKTMFAGYRCDGCGICARNCPRQAIIMMGGSKKTPYWTFKCEQCMRCAGFCPQKAVEGSYLLILTYCAIYFSIAIDVLIINVIKSLTGVIIVNNFVISAVLYYLYTLLILWIVYGAFQLLNRIPAINKMFTYLTFTYYWRKYKEPSTDSDKMQ